jgi:uncharacterized protein (TIGR03382 family)
MSGCFYGPFISGDQPVNCPVEIYAWESYGADSGEPPVATVMRNGATVDVMGTLEDLGSSEETVDIYDVDCDGVPVAHHTTIETFHHWRFTLAGANEGETLYLNGSYHGPILAPGTCPTTPLDPTPQCSGMYDWSVCEDTGSGSGSDNSGDIDTGCNAGGNNGFAGVLLGLAFVGVTRRRRAATMR